MADTDNEAKGGLFSTEVPGVLSGSYEFIGKAVATLEENIAATRSEVQAALNASQSAQSAAEDAEDAVQAIETNVQNIETNITNIQTNVNTLNTSSNNAADDAEKLAINAEDAGFTLSDGSTTGYSALHYNAKAQDAKTAAETAQTAAEDAQDAAELALDTFTDLFLGKKTADPTLDNDGDALQDGALYFNTTDNVLKFYDLGNTTWHQTTPTTAQQTNIDSAVANETNINAVNANSTNINTVAAIDTDVTAVAAIDSDVTTVATNDSNVTAVAGNATNINAVASNATNINAVASNATNINAVNANSTNINTVAGIDANVTTVAGISADVTAVANISSDIQDVQDKLAEIQTAADDLNEATSEIETVANAITNVDNVGNNIANVNSVATNISNVNTVATNLTDINAFADTYFIAATAPSSPTEGDLWFDTTNDMMMVYNGGSWQNAGSSVNGTAARFKFVATASQTAFTGTDANGVTLAYDAGYIDVYLNGVHLDPSDYTATDGSSITLASGAAAGDELYVVAFGTFTLANHYTRTEVDGLLGSIDATNLKDSSDNVVVDASSGNMVLGDNKKAIFGAGSDLQIYHDSVTNNSYIAEAGIGDLVFQGTNIRLQNTSGGYYVRAYNGGAVNLYHNNAAKLATTSTGVDVTGAITVNGSALEAGAKEGIFWENGQTVTSDYTITSSKNAGTFGPITIDTNVSVTIPSGSVWTIV